MSDYDPRIVIKKKPTPTLRAQPTTHGTKHDKSKAPMSLIPQSALYEVAEVFGFGAKKYGPHNWRGGLEWSRLSDALLRHVNAWIDGEELDPESGKSHLAHAACNLLMLLESQQKQLGEDDRYKSHE